MEVERERLPDRGQAAERLVLPVYRLDSKATHATLYTSSAATKSSLTSGKKPAFRYVGIAFYVGRSVQTTTPIGPS